MKCYRCRHGLDVGLAVYRWCPVNQRLVEVRQTCDQFEEGEDEDTTAEDLAMAGRPNQDQR